MAVQKKKQTTIPGGIANQNTSAKPLTKAQRNAVRASAAGSAGVTGASGANAPSLAPTSPARKFIGVPNDYFVNQSQTLNSSVDPWNLAGATQIAVGDPLYAPGDEYRTFPTDPQEVSNLQDAMVQAGYITTAQAKNIIKGTPDAITIGAFKKLLAASNQKAESWSSTLSESLSSQGTPAPAQKLSVPPLTINLTDPAAIKKTANDTAKTLYGANLPDDVLNNFVQNFQQAESQSQTLLYNQQYNPGAVQGQSGYGPGGTSTTPDLAAQAEQFIKTNPATRGQVAATGFGGQVMSALNSLRSSGNLPGG